MRNAFASEITALAVADERLVFLAGDIGNKLFDDYKKKCPGRFFNCGVAEANMVSVAAGLAMAGLRPVTYTITPFMTTRCLEQIRVDVCYQNLPVVIVGIGAGLSYAALNATHHACEDIAFLRMLPNMTVVCPADAVEVRLALRAAMQAPGPVYIRLGKKGEPVIHKTPPDFALGRGIDIRPGRDICLLSTGNMLPASLETADRLEAAGLSTRVVSMHTVKPLDEPLLREVFGSAVVVATVEEHSVLGGLGGSVAEWRADQSAGARLIRIGTSDEFLYTAGEQEYARERYGLTPEHIAGRIQQLYHQTVGSVAAPTHS
jgi:transketolase